MSHVIYSRYRSCSCIASTLMAEEASECKTFDTGKQCTSGTNTALGTNDKARNKIENPVKMETQSDTEMVDEVSECEPVPEHEELPGHDDPPEQDDDQDDDYVPPLTIKLKKSGGVKLRKSLKASLKKSKKLKKTRLRKAAKQYVTLKAKEVDEFVLAYVKEEPTDAICGGVEDSVAPNTSKRKGRPKKYFRKECGMCEKGFKTVQALEEHENLHIQGGVFVCLKCDTSFFQKDDLLAHIRAIHQHRIGRFKCDTCDKVYRSRKFLLQHQKSHMLHKLMVCPHCQ